MKAVSVPVSITTVLSPVHLGQVGTPLIDFVAEVSLGTLDVIVSFQAKEFFRQHSPHDVAQRLLAAVDYGRERGVQLSGYWYQTFQMIIDDAKWAEQADYKTCPAVGRQLSIEPNGSVFACKATARKLGTIDDWRGIFASPAYQDYGMRAYTNGPGCQGCELQGTCSGGSAGSAGGGERLDPSDVARLLRLYARGGPGPSGAPPRPESRHPVLTRSPGAPRNSPPVPAARRRSTIRPRDVRSGPRKGD